jgi:hypothetical protein
LSKKSFFCSNYTFFFKDESNIEDNLKYRIDNTIIHGRSFLRIDNTGYIIEYNNLLMAANEINSSFKNIWLCLNGKRKTCNGYAWVYKEVYSGNYDKFFIKDIYSKKIYSKLLNRTFNSAVEASKETGINKSSICNYLKGKQIPKNGDTWSYL